MRKTIAVGAAVAAAAALALVPVATAASDDGGPLLESGVIGSIPTAAGGPTIFGVGPGARPWDVARSSIEVSRDGELEIRIAGLVFSDTKLATPVAAVSASLFCNGVSVATTGTVTLSADGNARIEADITVPARCVAPVVLVHPGANKAAYIAASG